MGQGIIERPRVSIRFDSKAQLDRVRKAANARRWKINEFVLEAAEKFVAETLAETSKTAEQLTPTTLQPASNQ